MGGYNRVVLSFDTILMITTLFMRSWENPNNLNLFIDVISSSYWYAFFWTLGIIFLIGAGYYAYLIIKKVWTSTKKKKLTSNDLKSTAQERLPFAKKSIWNCRYLAIGAWLQLLSRKLVELLFQLIEQSGGFLHTNKEAFSQGELMLLGNRSFYSLIFFIIAPMFITFCFRNKFVRNIWILIYILGIAFFFLGYFLNMGGYTS